MTIEQYIQALKGYVEYAERPLKLDGSDETITMKIKPAKLKLWLEDVINDATLNNDLRG